ncbi:MAG: ferritin family protein [Anaerolineaceae bacterium]|nr:ferritin family protein [Anaerolineaceae bacterium]
MENTVEQAFEVSIMAESAAAQLYRGLAAKFASYPDVAAFWQQYASEEEGHARWLEGLKSRLAPEVLTNTVNAHTMELMQAVTDFSVEKELKNVCDMEDAFQLVSDLESGETNAIFEFLLNAFEKDDQTRAFLRAQLNNHVTKLSNDLPKEYKSRLARKAIQALC